MYNESCRHGRLLLFLKLRLIKGQTSSVGFKLHATTEIITKAVFFELSLLLPKDPTGSTLPLT